MSIITKEVADYLSEVQIPIRLAVATELGWPTVISLWFLFEDGLLYCATQQTAKVVAYLRENPQCGFEVAADTPPYCGVRGKGIAHIDIELGATILKRLLTRYLGDVDAPLAQKLLRRQQDEVAITIQPINMFTWNFSDRMRDSLPETSITKICPD